MTRLGKTVKREVSLPSPFSAFPTQLIVSLTREGITTREKGRRTTYGPIPYAHIHLLGARMKAEELIRERKARRKARRNRG